MPTVVTLDRISKAYEQKIAVKDLSLQIDEGIMFGLLGPNGSGKTSTIRMMIGITMPDSGSVSLFGKPFTLEFPVLRGFNFAGGSRLIPEFVALVLALSTYTAAFIAEIARAGLMSVHKGQMEAGSSLGLSRGQALRMIVVPQAMRVILPPLTSQYLNLTKNSSLAVAIGYPDLVSVFAGTTLSQTGQAIEIIMITMGVYLALSLVTSAIMSFYNWRLSRSLGA